MRIDILVILVIFLLPLTGAGCGKSRPIFPFEPSSLDDGWQVSTLKDQGLNSNLIEALSSRIKGGEFGPVHSMLIVRNGFLVFEEYYKGSGPYDIHTLASATKSVASILIGIAIDKGFIAGVDEHLPDLLPTQWRNSLGSDARKKEIRFHDILTMTAGWEWDEWSQPYGDPLNSLTNLYENENSGWINYMIERPLIAPPGQVFAYSSGNSVLLGGIIRDQTGLQADKFAEKYLFNLLDVSSYDWARQKDGLAHTGGGLNFLSRDFAKIGYLIWSKGVWRGNRIVSEEWINESVLPWVKDMGGGRPWQYGYQWWSTLR